METLPFSLSAALKRLNQLGERKRSRVQPDGPVLRVRPGAGLAKVTAKVICNGQEGYLAKLAQA